LFPDYLRTKKEQQNNILDLLSDDDSEDDSEDDSDYESDSEDDEPYIPVPIDYNFVNDKVINFFKPKMRYNDGPRTHYKLQYINNGKKKTGHQVDLFIINQMFKHFDICPLTCKHTYAKLLRDFKKEHDTNFFDDYSTEDIKFWDDKRRTNKFNPSLVK
jgi:hypothetical protein